jgi:hypothetical protein
MVSLLIRKVSYLLNHFLIILLFLLYVFPLSLSGQSRNRSEREHLLVILKKDFRQLQDSVVIITMDKATKYAGNGDSLMFSLLLDWAPHSDGYVSEGLGYNFGELFLHKPEFFLKCVCKRPIAEQKAIASLTFFEDGGGMRPEEFIQAEITLKKYRSYKNSQVRSTATLFLSILEYVRKEVNN